MVQSTNRGFALRTGAESKVVNCRFEALPDRFLSRLGARKAKMRKKGITRKSWTRPVHTRPFTGGEKREKAQSRVGGSRDEKVRKGPSHGMALPSHPPLRESNTELSAKAVTQSGICVRQTKGLGIQQRGKTNSRKSAFVRPPCLIQESLCSAIVRGRPPA